MFFVLATLCGVLRGGNSALFGNRREAVISPIITPIERLEPLEKDLLAKLTEDDIIESGQNFGYRAFMRTSEKWPGGLVPFTMDIYGDTERIKKIYDAMAVIQQHTCVKFVPRNQHADYINFMDDGVGQCYSFVGMVGGGQNLSVGAGCEAQIGVILHEINHALGMVHEQSRPDRDHYVTINWSAIKPKRDKNFQKYNSAQVDVLNLPYDYNSIMHYHAHAFTRDGSLTIVPKKPGAKDVIGQREGFSACDLAKLNTLYDCNITINCDDTTGIKSDTSPPPNNSTTQKQTTTVKATTQQTTPFVKSTTAPTTTKQPPKKTTTEVCRDNHMDCPNAISNPALCYVYPGIFLLKCRKACNNCDSSLCMDGQGAMARQVCGRYTPRYCMFAQVKNLCPASCLQCE